MSKINPDHTERVASIINQWIKMAQDTISEWEKPGSKIYVGGIVPPCEPEGEILHIPDGSKVMPNELLKQIGEAGLRGTEAAGKLTKFFKVEDIDSEE